LSHISIHSKSIQQPTTTLDTTKPDHQNQTTKPLTKSNRPTPPPQGWHLELDNPEEELTFKGVVFNEMGGGGRGKGGGVRGVTVGGGRQSMQSAMDDQMKQRIASC